MGLCILKFSPNQFHLSKVNSTIRLSGLSVIWTKHFWLSYYSQIRSMRRSLAKCSDCAHFQGRWSRWFRRQHWYLRLEIQVNFRTIFLSLLVLLDIFSLRDAIQGAIRRISSDYCHSEIVISHSLFIWALHLPFSYTKDFKRPSLTLWSDHIRPERAVMAISWMS